MTAPDVLAAVETGEAARDSASTTSLARSMAKAVADGLLGTEPAPVAGAPRAADSAVAALEQAKAGIPAGPGAQPPASGSAVPAAEAVVEEVVAEEPAQPIAELEQALLDAGIDLGVTAADVPAELRPVYDRLVQSAAEIADSASAQQVEASDAIRRVQDFQERLEKEPDQVLLAMAVMNPALFKQVAQVVQIMETDPAQRDLVIRELETKARMREIDRREILMGESTRQVQARRVIAETSRAARKYNVPKEIAEKVVAALVTANGGNLEVSEVDSIVKELTPGAAAPARQKIVIRAPDAQRVVAAAPSQPAAPAAVPSPGLRPSEERSGGGGVFSKLVRGAWSRAMESAD